MQNLFKLLCLFCVSSCLTSAFAGDRVIIQCTDTGRAPSFMLRVSQNDTLRTIRVSAFKKDERSNGFVMMKLTYDPNETLDQVTLSRPVAVGSAQRYTGGGSGSTVQLLYGMGPQTSGQGVLSKFSVFDMVTKKLVVDLQLICRKL
ncbi:MAG TPA: hypothetical protein VNJ01_04175 [Bacteriovoracaceae bacterium]|nr:hypothetical protein [Bacteriovoracaceae bacterium]